MQIRLAGIITDTLVNGEGLRTVLFSQGCKHNCKECFSTFTHSFDGGQEFDIDTLANKINENTINTGITFSGGDPFEQAEKFYTLSQKINKNIWCYTGYTFEQLLNTKDEWKQKLLHAIDVLVDGKFEIENYNPHLKYKGSSNQRIIDVKKSLENNTVVLWRSKRND